MTSKFQPPSPTSPVRHTLKNILIQHTSDIQQSPYKYQLIYDLYSKFLTINNQVNTDFDLSAFNLIEFNPKQTRMDCDQQMIIAKLKRLENNAQLKRINMELENRKRKNYKTKVKDYNILPQKSRYMNTYREFRQQNSKQKQNEIHTDSQQELSIQKPKGITFYSQLRRHPKFLSYTIDKIKSRQLIKEQLINFRQLKRQQLKNKIKRITNQSNPKIKKITNPNQNPQTIADNIFRKIYTKRNKDRPISIIKQDKRLSLFIHKQQNIMDSIDERSLSKQLHKKLKQKLNDIASELYDDQKRYKTKSSVGNKIRINKTINIQE